MESVDGSDMIIGIAYHARSASVTDDFCNSAQHMGREERERAAFDWRQRQIAVTWQSKAAKVQSSLTLLPDSR